MFKIILFAAIFAFAVAVPAPGPEAKADPGLLAAAYTAPLISAPIAAPALAYSSAYTAPIAAPALAYSSAYSAYSPYAAPLAYNNLVASPYYASAYSPYSNYVVG